MSLFSMQRKETHFLVILHSESAPCGNFCKALGQRGARITQVKAWENESIPEAPGGFSGLVVMGGPQNACDDAGSPHFLSLMELMRAFDAQGKPVAGICLGCQLLSRAHGGTVKRLGRLEFGFVEQRSTKAGKSDPVVGGLETPPLMEFHEDSASLPPGGTLLMEGGDCPVQCFKVGNASYGFQFHMEVDLQIAMKWIYLLRSGQIGTYHRYAKQFDDEFYNNLLAGIDAYVESSERFCTAVAERFISMCASTE